MFTLLISQFHKKTSLGLHKRPPFKAVTGAKVVQQTNSSASI